MGGALLSGWLAAGLPSGAIVAVDPLASRAVRTRLRRQGVVLRAAAPGGR